MTPVCLPVELRRLGHGFSLSDDRILLEARQYENLAELLFRFRSVGGESDMCGRTLDPPEQAKSILVTTDLSVRAISGNFKTRCFSPPPKRVFLYHNRASQLGARVGRIIDLAAPTQHPLKGHVGKKFSLAILSQPCFTFLTRRRLCSLIF